MPFSSQEHRKGKYLNMLENYHIYEISTDQMNDTDTDVHIPLFKALQATNAR
jgi:hypothetical protein